MHSPPDPGVHVITESLGQVAHTVGECAGDQGVPGASGRQETRVPTLGVSDKQRAYLPNMPWRSSPTSNQSLIRQRP